MSQSHNEISLSLPDEDVLDEYLEVVIDNGEETRDRYMAIIVDDQGQAHTLLAGLDQQQRYALLDSFEGRPKNRHGRRIGWEALPAECQGLFWQEVLSVNGQYN